MPERGRFSVFADGAVPDGWTVDAVEDADGDLVVDQVCARASTHSTPVERGTTRGERVPVGSRRRGRLRDEGLSLNRKKVTARRDRR